MGKRKVASLAFTGVAGVGTAVLAAGPAFAAGGTWTATPTGAYTPHATKITLGALVTLTCTSANATGKVLAGTGADSKPVASIATATFNNCTGLGASIIAKLNKPAYLYASGATSTGGKTKGYIAGKNGKSTNAISATPSGSTFGGGCHAVVTGFSVPGSFSNTNHKLIINKGHAKTLTVKSVSGCTGIANGSKAYFSASYTTTPAITVHNT